MTTEVDEKIKAESDISILNPSSVCERVCISSTRFLMTGRDGSHRSYSRHEMREEARVCEGRQFLATLCRPVSWARNDQNSRWLSHKREAERERLIGQGN